MFTVVPVRLNLLAETESHWEPEGIAPGSCVDTAQVLRKLGR